MHVSSKALRYARAVLRVAAEKKIEDRVEAELEGLAEFLGEQPVARLILESPASSSTSQGDLLRRIEAAHEFSDVTRNTLRLLVSEGRFPLLGEIVTGFRRELRQRRGIVQAEVTTAEPLGPEQAEALEQAIKQLSQAEAVELKVAHDPRLVAGTVTRIGSVVYDGSLDSALGRLRQQLISE